MNRFLLATVFPASLALLSGACATTVPAPLTLARLSYASSADGPAAQMAPRYLANARDALDKANAEFAKNGDTGICRDYAYIAENKLEEADSVARSGMSAASEQETTVATESLSIPARGLTVASSR
jgi:hypothetical protein